MSIIKYRKWPWLLSELEDFERNFFPSEEEESKISTSRWMPLVDIKDEKDSYIIHADIPGVDPKDIDISLEQNTLTIKGERSLESAEHTENYSRIERRSGSFYRSFTLPGDVDSENVRASSTNGVLKIEIPKRKEAVSKRIKIETE